MRQIGSYRQESNIQTSVSIKSKDECDYLALRRLLKGQMISIGEYLIDCYRELDKDNPDWRRLREIRYNR